MKFHFVSYLHLFKLFLHKNNCSLFDITWNIKCIKHMYIYLWLTVQYLNDRG